MTTVTPSDGGVEARGEERKAWVRDGVRHEIVGEFEDRIYFGVTFARRVVEERLTSAGACESLLEERELQRTGSRVVT